jgi:hypothetical protein
MGYHPISCRFINPKRPELCLFLARGLVYNEQTCARSKGQRQASSKAQNLFNVLLTAMANRLQLVSFAYGDCEYILTT